MSTEDGQSAASAHDRGHERAQALRRTRSGATSAVANGLLAFLKRSPETATREDIRRFQLHLSETGVSICNRNRIMTGLRFLLRVTLRRLDLASEVYHLREPQKIPLVMSPDETRRLLAVAGSLKARVLLGLGYGCGLRAGEVVRLKVKHIDSAQKHHSHRAVQRPQGPQRHAVARDARSVAPMVEGAPARFDATNAASRNVGCFLAARPASR